MNQSNIELINFINLSLKDKFLVLEWRNNDLVRKWMFNSDLISKKNHLEFIQSLKNNQVKEYFLVKKDRKKIGVIYFINKNDNDKSLEFGIYSNPHIKKTGKTLMSIICSYAFGKLKFERLIAKVFYDNKKAINLYKYQGFKQFNFKNITRKKIVCMELQNEN